MQGGDTTQIPTTTASDNNRQTYEETNQSSSVDAARRSTPRVDPTNRRSGLSQLNIADSGEHSISLAPDPEAIDADEPEQQPARVETETDSSVEVHEETNEEQAPRAEPSQIEPENEVRHEDVCFNPHPEDGDTQFDEPPTAQIQPTELPNEAICQPAKVIDELPIKELATNDDSGDSRSNANLDLSPNPSSTVSDEAPEHTDASSTDSDAAPIVEDRRRTDIDRADAVPRNIGARRSRRNYQASAAREKSRAPVSPKPELVCRELRSDQQWEIVLSVPSGCDVVGVRQNETVLSRQSSDYRLPSYAGNVSILYADDTSDTLELFLDKPLIFKLRKDWEGIGRKIKGITQGEFILIVPRDWTRKVAPPIAPAGCSDDSFRAHYFSVSNAGEQISVDGFEEYPVSNTNSWFKIQGTRVLDDSDEGELFVGTPPNIRVEPGIGVVRVGEEAERGWPGEHFNPLENTLAEILNGRQGRFYVRVYQPDATAMTDGGVFRYFSDLTAIHLNGNPYDGDVILAPQSSGHEPATLRFVDAKGRTLRPNAASENPHSTTSADGGVSIAGHPDGDESAWTLQSDQGTIDVVIRLPRVWWRIVHRGDDLADWLDEPLTMTRSEFRDFQDAVLNIRLPSHQKRISAGFGETLNQVFPAEKSDDGWRYVDVPLNDFIDYDEIDQFPYEPAAFKFRCDETVLTPIRLLTDPAPEITSFAADRQSIIVGEHTQLSWMTQHAENRGVAIYPDIGTVNSVGSILVSPSRNETYTLKLRARGRDDVTKALRVTVLPPATELTARVRRGIRGNSNGKGFSRREVRAANLNNLDARTLGIPLDNRRRSEHAQNVSILREAKIHAQRE